MTLNAFRDLLLCGIVASLALEHFVMRGQLPTNYIWINH